MASGQVVDVFVDPSKLTLISATATHVTTTATVTANGHGFSNSDTIKVQGADQPEYNGNFVITNVTTNTFDYTMTADPGTNATGTLQCAKLNLAGDDGTTDALAYADLQYAVDNSTMSTGLQFNLKSGSTNVLTSIFRGKSGSSVRDPMIVKGYDSTPDDGGIGVIDLGGQYYISPSYNYNLFMDLKIGNTSVWGFSLNNNSDFTNVLGCEIHDCTSGGFNGSQSASSCNIIGCYVHDCTGTGINSPGNYQTIIKGNYLKNGTTKKFTHAISTGNAAGHCVIGNLVHVDGSSNGMSFTTGSSVARSLVSDNSVFGDGSTGTGIVVTNGNNGSSSYGLNNLVEGFATGIICGSATNDEYGGLLNNSVFDCTTSFNKVTAAVDFGNEVRTSSLFDKGTLPTDFTSPTFWNDVYAWFSPTSSDWGNSYNAPRIDRGASQHEGGGGGGGHILHPLVNSFHPLGS
jgi:hypothetical protein